LKDFDREDELILWPENAIDVDPIRNALVSDKLKSLQSVTKVPLLAGAILDDKELLNTALLFDIEGKPQSTYVKRYLTPFGEYIPLRSIASLVSPHTDRVTDFTPGTEFVVHQMSGVQVSTIICYEILSDAIIRESASSSGIITVLTNSATFAGSAEGNQQMNITRIRAVETGKNIVSVSTTGPSAFINHRGEVLSRLDDGEVGSLSSEVEVRDGSTLAVEYGGIFSNFAILLSIVSIVYAVFRRGRRL
jgi:apolipoprotein N-acyltransferase